MIRLKFDKQAIIANTVIKYDMDEKQRWRLSLLQLFFVVLKLIQLPSGVLKVKQVF